MNERREGGIDTKGILSRLSKEGTPDICNNMDEPGARYAM